MAADDLEHFQPPHQLVAGEVNHAHPAAPQLADDLPVGVVDQLGRQGVGRRGRDDRARGSVAGRCRGRRPSGGGLVRPDPGLLKPAQEFVRRKLGNPPLARIATFEVLAHRGRRDVVELAQAVSLQDRVGRVDGGGGAHDGISWSRVPIPIVGSITERERPQHRGTCREKANMIQEVPSSIRNPSTTWPQELASCFSRPLPVFKTLSQLGRKSSVPGPAPPGSLWPRTASPPPHGSAVPPACPT